MLYYVVFIFIGTLLYVISEITKKKGFDNLSILRNIPRSFVTEGENVSITLVVENNKKLPITFLLVDESLPLSVENLNEETSFVTTKVSNNRSFLRVGGKERVKRTYKVKMNKRGVFFIKDIRVVLGDIFAFSTVTQQITDFNEIVVYPKVQSLKNIKLESTNILGEEIVRRWIYKDPLYIRGIREYSSEDRMKDIHWKSSLKMNKLMVKDYDYTSEREIVFIIDVQCGDPYYQAINEKAVERAITIGVSMARWAVNEEISTGMWTNAHIIGYNKKAEEVNPSINSFKAILELCARIDYSPASEFWKYLISKEREFKNNCTYVIISSYLNNQSISEIMKIKRNGYKLVFIDVSKDSTLPSLSGIEKICYTGRSRNE